MRKKSHLPDKMLTILTCWHWTLVTHSWPSWDTGWQSHFQPTQPSLYGVRAACTRQNEFVERKGGGQERERGGKQMLVKMIKRFKLLNTLWDDYESLSIVNFLYFFWWYIFMNPSFWYFRPPANTPTLAPSWRSEPGEITHLTQEDLEGIVYKWTKKLKL